MRYILQSSLLKKQFFRTKISHPIKASVPVYPVTHIVYQDLKPSNKHLDVSEFSVLRDYFAIKKLRILLSNGLLQKFKYAQRENIVDRLELPETLDLDIDKITKLSFVSAGHWAFEFPYCRNENTHIFGMTIENLFNP